MVRRMNGASLVNPGPGLWDPIPSPIIDLRRGRSQFEVRLGQTTGQATGFTLGSIDLPKFALLAGGAVLLGYIVLKG